MQALSIWASGLGWPWALPQQPHPSLHPYSCPGQALSPDLLGSSISRKERWKCLSVSTAFRPASVCPAQAGVLHLGLGGRIGWAGCIPVFFAELGMGFSDIQAFTEHCFTTAGTKREKRVTAPATRTQVSCWAMCCLATPSKPSKHGPPTPGQGPEMKREEGDRSHSIACPG